MSKIKVTNLSIHFKTAHRFNRGYSCCRSLKRQFFFRSSLKVLLPLILLCSHSQYVSGQHLYTNPGFFLSSTNPSFIASPMQYNSAAVIGNSQNDLAAHGCININSLYSAVGINYQSVLSMHIFNFNYAYHSFFLPSQEHLLGGIELGLVSDEENKWRDTQRLGLLLCSNPGNRYFFGITYGRSALSFDMKSKTATMYKRSTGIQLGRGIAAISRRLTINGMLVFNYFSGVANHFLVASKSVHQSQAFISLWSWQWFAGLGWQQQQLREHILLLRSGYFVQWRNKSVCQLGIAYSLPLNFQIQTFEFSIKKHIRT